MADEISKVDNPWRKFIENCIDGDNYFRGSEYRELLADLDRGYQAEAQVATLARQLSEATRRLGEVESLLREAAGHMKRGRAYYSEYHDFIERITALTKEPAK